MNQKSDQALLQLKTLGDPQVLVNGEPVQGLPATKSRALIFYLAVTGSTHSRDELAGIFWPNMGETEAKTNLRQALTRLRKVLPLHLDITRHEVGFNPAARLWLDTAAFEAAINRGNPNNREGIAHLQAAADLYQDDFLENFALEDEEWFTEWVVAERDRLRLLALQALHTLTNYFTPRREIVLGLRYVRQLLTLEPTRETGHQQLMQLLAWNGQYRAALAQYERCQQVLSAMLSLEPLPKTTALAARILAVQDLPRNPVAVDSAPFVGRHDQLAALHHLLHEPVNRLITITGPGGVGKTQLAHHLATEQRRFFLDGVYFVTLAHVTTTAQCASAIAATIGLTLPNGQQTGIQLCNHLRNKELLLILDNFEQLLQDNVADDAIALLETCLTAAADLKLLVTSRERLNLQEELVFELEGLSYPAQPMLAENMVDIETYAAIQLFQQVAQTTDSQFNFAAEQAAVVQICQLVQGLPLAIKLAASLTDYRSCAERATAIAANLDILAQSNPTIPQRHQSLRATLHYSWSLLTPVEQSLLTRLSVFRGGFDDAAAAQIAGASLDLLTALIEKSLLRLEQQHSVPQEPRYEMHSFVAYFAAERLVDEPTTQSNEIYRQHCAYYMALLAEQGEALNGPAMADTVVAIQQNLENMRSAWHWAVNQLDVTALLQGCEGLERFYFITNQFVEGQAAMQVAVDKLDVAVANNTHPQIATTARMKHCLAAVLTALARLLMIQRRYNDAICTAQAGLRWAQQAEATDLIIRNRYCWGVTLSQQGDYTVAIEHIATGVALATTEQHHELQATGWHYQGGIQYHLGHYGKAQAYFEKAWGYFNPLAPAFPIQRASLLNNLGNIHLQLGHFAQAEQFYRDCLALRRTADQQQIGGTITIYNLGRVAFAQHQYTDALGYYTEALQAYQRSGNRQGESMVLGGLGELYHQVGDYARAKQLYEQDIAIMRESDQRARLGSSMALLGLLWYELGDLQQAVDLCQQAVELARQQGTQTVLGTALTYLGHVQTHRANDGAARLAYQEALLLLRQLGQNTLALESLSGLARLDLKQGRLAQARAQVDEILQYLTTGNADGILTPMQIYLTCYEVLNANHDQRAQQIIASAIQQLQISANNIEDEALRHQFLHDVSTHRRLLEVYRN